MAVILALIFMVSEDQVHLVALEQLFVRERLDPPLSLRLWQLDGLKHF
jgi:hypothetical protein